MGKLYRKSAIEKLSNPEQLDRAITISSPMSWLVLVGIFFVIIATIVWAVQGTLPDSVTVKGVVVSPADAGAVYAESAGVVTKVLKKTGDSIAAGDPVVEIRSSGGTEMVVTADRNGTLTDILVEENSQVYIGAEIARYTPETNQNQIIVCYVPFAVAQQLEEGMKVRVYPSSVDYQDCGHMEAEIQSVGEYAASTRNMRYVLGEDNLVAEQFLEDGPVCAVLCLLKEDDSTKSGFYWTSENAAEVTLANGTFVSARIVTDESRPITKFLRGLREKLED